MGRLLSKLSWEEVHVDYSLSECLDGKTLSEVSSHHTISFQPSQTEEGSNSLRPLARFDATGISIGLKQMKRVLDICGTLFAWAILFMKRMSPVRKSS